MKTDLAKYDSRTAEQWPDFTTEPTLQTTSGKSPARKSSIRRQPPSLLGPRPAPSWTTVKGRKLLLLKTCGRTLPQHPGMEFQDPRYWAEDLPQLQCGKRAYAMGTSRCQAIAIGPGMVDGPLFLLRPHTPLFSRMSMLLPPLQTAIV
ncbi:hypothetical protein FQN60_018543 [Etheostoma spectabile]|uniref:Uncharacterized protein n=1 Tax=Etheostoma spectabile TaxID=54343 RepID=A0A5J5DIM7_9PERO|nr:hypothetical protein FQN60_018543 [Etheostoma spectabile]